MIQYIQLCDIKKILFLHSSEWTVHESAASCKTATLVLSNPLPSSHPLHPSLHRVLITSHVDKSPHLSADLQFYQPSPSAPSIHQTDVMTRRFCPCHSFIPNPIAQQCFQNVSDSKNQQGAFN